MTSFILLIEFSDHFEGDRLRAFAASAADQAGRKRQKTQTQQKSAADDTMYPVHCFSFSV